jgi:hypothetical protein
MTRSAVISLSNFRSTLPLIPEELPEWQVFYVELLKQLGLEPEHYKLLLDIQHKWDSKIEGLEKAFSNVKASRPEKKRDCFEKPGQPA